MDEQLIKRVGPRPTSGSTPIWCWYAQDKRQMSQDIYYPNQVCLELEVPNNQVLLSDFDLWHIVLGQGYFSKTAESYDQEIAEVDKLPPLQKEQAYRKSWEQIFNVNKDGQWIQACIWNLKYEQVVKVCHRKRNHRPKIFIPKRKEF